MAAKASSGNGSTRGKMVGPWPLARGPSSVGLFVFALAASACDLPSLREARETADALPETSFLYAADGTSITALHAGEDRVVVRSRKIPDVMRDAVIAIEDQRFYDHSGLDMRALLRAAYVDATTGEVVEGGSTITQQLVKKLYVGDEQTVDRKIARRTSPGSSRRSSRRTRSSRST